MSDTRYAVIENRGDHLETIKRYMPSNYTARTMGNHIVISGTDSAGWGLSTYVLPRLASGMYFAREVTKLELWGMRVVFACPECGQSWTAADDAEEYAYGHDCEV